jgi:hypothetical protein
MVSQVQDEIGISREKTFGWLSLRTIGLSAMQDSFDMCKKYKTVVVDYRNVKRWLVTVEVSS